MRYDETVKKFEAFVAKEPELRKRYLEAMETLQVDLPPVDEQFLPYRKLDDLFPYGETASARSRRSWRSRARGAGSRRVNGATCDR